ncbi:hypothetical protein BDQ12DRAFT_748902 [Crucibulum laeve]|uniref:Protein kinase domain-containing protein n=1 Tax=Crucibulum laeve TaxID=68775 RepID=A0A5C3LF75_9AGAR|nr:hypothetical protein BDQ12DRAFT_748902 [Crucibulum laeve]
MHGHLIAHQDLTTQNIMKDTRPIFLQGWHFFAIDFSPDVKDHLTPLTRIDNPMRYFIIDYDCSVRLQPRQAHLIHGLGGQDPDGPFKVDIFTVGNMLYEEFYRVYLGLDFLSVLINNMI